MILADGVPPSALALLRARSGASVPELLRELADLARAEGGEVDLVAAGILARRAWEALREETAAALVRAQGPAPPPPAADPWDAFLASPWAQGIDATRIATRELSTRSVLEAPTRRASVPVAPRLATLDDLAAALREAYAEAHATMTHERARRERRDARRAARSEAARASVAHEDDTAADMQRVLAALPADGSPVPLRAIAASSAPLDRVSALIGALHLARAGRVRVVQNEFPSGSVMVARAPSPAG